MLVKEAGTLPEMHCNPHRLEARFLLPSPVETREEPEDKRGPVREQNSRLLISETEEKHRGRLW